MLSGGSTKGSRTGGIAATQGHTPDCPETTRTEGVRARADTPGLSSLDQQRTSGVTEFEDVLSVIHQVTSWMQTWMNPYPFGNDTRSYMKSIRNSTREATSSPTISMSLPKNHRFRLAKSSGPGDGMRMMMSS